MKLFHAISLLAITSFALSYPIEIEARSPPASSSEAAVEARDLNSTAATMTLNAVKIDKASAASTASTTSKAVSASSAKSSTSATSNSNAASPQLPSGSAVQAASSQFANDANKVSASLNALPSTTDTNTIKSLASTAFTAESDEDSHRAVLAAAAGSAGANSNSLIVKNTPIVLSGLQAIINNPTTATVKSNVAAIQAARGVWNCLKGKIWERK